MGLQFSITAIGSIILQKSVNALGTTIIASVSAAAKVQNLVISPMDAFGVSMATFAGQNYGAGKIDRVRRGVRQVFWMLTVYSLLALGIVYFSGSTIALLFVDASETEILACTQHFLIMNGLFYIPLGVIYVLRNTLQGVGFSKIAMLSGLLELVARSVMWDCSWCRNSVLTRCASPVPRQWIMADLILIVLYSILMKRLDGQPARKEA